MKERKKAHDQRIDSSLPSLAWGTLTVPSPMDGTFDPLERVKCEATILDEVDENDLS